MIVPARRFKSGRLGGESIEGPSKQRPYEGKNKTCESALCRNMRERLQCNCEHL